MTRKERYQNFVKLDIKTAKAAAKYNDVFEEYVKQGGEYLKANRWKECRCGLWQSPYSPRREIHYHYMVDALEIQMTKDMYIGKLNANS